MSELLEFVLLRIISTVEIIAPNEIISQNDLLNVRGSQTDLTYKMYDLFATICY